MKGDRGGLHAAVDTNRLKKKKKKTKKKNLKQHYNRAF